MYLIDANVLITAKNQYYPLDSVRPYWDWLITEGEAGNVKIPREAYDEVNGTDDLALWIQQEHVKDALLLDEDADPILVQRVLAEGYQSNSIKFTDSELIKARADPFIISYALADNSRVVVTKEVSATRRRLGDTRIPDACTDCLIRCINDFKMLRELAFKI